MGWGGEGGGEGVHIPHVPLTFTLYRFYVVRLLCYSNVPHYYALRSCTQQFVVDSISLVYVRGVCLDVAARRGGAPRFVLALLCIPCRCVRSIAVFSISPMLLSPLHFFSLPLASIHIHPTPPGLFGLTRDRR